MHGNWKKWKCCDVFTQWTTSTYFIYFSHVEFLSRFRVNVTHCLYLDEHLLLLSYGFYLLVFPFICMLFPSMTLAQLLTHLCIVTGFVESPIRFNEYNIRNVFASTVVFLKQFYVSGYFLLKIIYNIVQNFDWDRNNSWLKTRDKPQHTFSL